MRRLLFCASIFSIPLVVLSVLMSKRGSVATDWLRITARNRSAILVSSRQEVGAGMITDPDTWVRRDRRAIRYKHFRPTDLRREFDSTVAGFGYRAEPGARLVLVPMWFVTLLGAAPPILLWLSQPKRLGNDDPVKQQVRSDRRAAVFNT